MLLAQAPPHFPPWYFWLFVLAEVIVIFGSITAMAIYAIRSSMLRRIRERELAAQLIEQMLRDHHMSPAEIEQVIQSFWLGGGSWGRLRNYLSQFGKFPGVAIPPQKPIAARTASALPLS